MAIPMRSGNPALSRATFLDSASGNVLSRDGAMTINGTVNKTAFLLILVLCGAMFSWSRAQGGVDTVYPWMMLGAFGGFVVAMVTIFKQQWSPMTAPVYAVLEACSSAAPRRCSMRNIPASCCRRSD